MENNLEQAIETTSPSSPQWILAAGVIGGLTIASQATATVNHPVLSTAQRGAVNDQLPLRGADLTSGFSGYESYLEGWHAASPTSSWYFLVANRLEELSTKPDGWKGEKSFAASADALASARTLLWKLAQEGIDRRPTVGLDHEGTFSFMWIDANVKADLTVYEDGTYSFYAKYAERMASVDEASISEPLDSRLLGALLS